MKPTRKNPEQGQIIIILALAIIVLMGFAGLAIDGGMIYADRRNEQNASDAASLAGAGKAARILAAGGSSFFTESWNCNGADFINGNIRHESIVAAQNSAESNNFNNPEYEVGVYCHDGGDNYYDVAVTITKQTQTSFLQLIFNRPMINVVPATSRVFPRGAAYGDNAIVSLNTDQSCNGLDRGMVFEGSSVVTVVSGTVHSNSCIKASGGSGVVFTDQDQVGTYNWTYTENGNGWHLQPAPVYTTTYLYPIDISPDCTGMTNWGSITGSGTYNPGIYTDINVTSNSAIVRLNPGLYCIQGPNSGVKVTGGTFTGDDVTFYLPQADSLFDTSGNATVQLFAPPADCDVNPSPYDCSPDVPNAAIGGLLIYKAGTPTGNQGSTLGGNAASLYEGSVYCPDSTIRVDGTAGLQTIKAQIIGLNVYVSGSPDMNIIYDGKLYYHPPVKMQLHR